MSYDYEFFFESLYSSRHLNIMINSKLKIGYSPEKYKRIVSLIVTCQRKQEQTVDTDMYRGYEDHQDKFDQKVDLQKDGDAIKA